MNGSLVKQLREQKQLSRGDLANAIGVTRMHLWRIEKGQVTNPSHRTVVALAKALDTTPEQLTA